MRLAAADPGKTAEAISKSEALHRRLWAQAMAAAEKEKSVITSMFAQSLNDVINLHERRLIAGSDTAVCRERFGLTLYAFAFVDGGPRLLRGLPVPDVLSQSLGWSWRSPRFSS